ncbi:MAG: hypothetical protein QW356_06070 [Candidatus Hadarchaeales archaeon]
MVSTTFRLPDELSPLWREKSRQKWLLVNGRPAYFSALVRVLADATLRGKTITLLGRGNKVTLEVKEG